MAILGYIHAVSAKQTAYWFSCKHDVTTAKNDSASGDETTLETNGVWELEGYVCM